jgi:chemotaxis protein MotB
MAMSEQERLELQLQEERALNDSLRARLGLAEVRSPSSDQLTLLRQENERLAAAYRSAQANVEKLASQIRAEEPVVLTVSALPPELNDALNEFARQHSGIVEFDSVKGTVKWKSDLLFDTGSDEVRGEMESSLGDFVGVIQSRAAGDFNVIVAGHTDNVRIAKPATRELHPTNWHLSAHRAISVARVLMERGYPAERIGVAGYGEYRPVASNASSDGKSRNRRVEIYLVPKGQIVTAADR